MGLEAATRGSTAPYIIIRANASRCVGPNNILFSG